MRNVFLLYIPPTNHEALVHYEDTIASSVDQARVLPHLTRKEGERLKRAFGDRSLKVWGSKNSDRNRSSFDKMSEGDDILIITGKTIRFMGKVSMKVINPSLSHELWQPLRGTSSVGWDLIYFIANPVQLDVPFEEFGKRIGYKSTLQLRGFSPVDDDKLQAFYDHYGDVYSVLQTIHEGRTVLEREEAAPPENQLVEVSREDIEEVIKSEVVSDHVKMQWKLASLGRKTGAKVWIPASDQAKLKRIYQFNEFESEFAAGLDLPKSYVENIDVVWKEDYRIHAAFEVENTTAVYSGLLRFADLTVLAPNTTYPLLIVAPQQRRGRVRDQLQRPAFKRLALTDKVKFLPYEEVDAAHERFEDIDRGLSAEVILDKAETLAA
jgi:hypothetical protein